jgi:hypothetical protein
MTFIMTNHNLSPLTPVNDPLVNSLSVTLPRPLEWLTLNFGYHTEHHLFPTASTRHGRAIRDAICTRYPERYQTMPLGTALVQLYNTARVYQDHVTLVDPPSGKTWPALVPRPRAALAAPAVASAPTATSKLLDEAAKKLDVAAAAAHRAFDDAAAKASKAIDDAKAAASKAIDDVLEPEPDPSRI